MTADGGRSVPFKTSITLETETKRVVELLLRMHKRATIYGPGQEMIHPRRPGGYQKMVGQPP